MQSSWTRLRKLNNPGFLYCNTSCRWYLSSGSAEYLRDLYTCYSRNLPYNDGEENKDKTVEWWDCAFFLVDKNGNCRKLIYNRRLSVLRKVLVWQRLQLYSFTTRTWVAIVGKHNKVLSVKRYMKNTIQRQDKIERICTNIIYLFSIFLLSFLFFKRAHFVINCIVYCI